jgi:hypothetical protein
VVEIVPPADQLRVLFVADPSYVVFRPRIATEHDWLDVPLYLPFKAFILEEPYVRRNAKRREILKVECPEHGQKAVQSPVHKTEIKYQCPPIPIKLLKLPGRFTSRARCPSLKTLKLPQI